MCRKRSGIAKDLLFEKYINKLREAPELYVGIELEYPIVQLNGGPTNLSVSKELMNVIIEQLGFSSVKEDKSGNPIELHHKCGDIILFELSYNILEFAFAKAHGITEVEDRFSSYLNVIQSFLREHQHELQGVGIHPHWQLNDNRPIEVERYQMLSNFLKLSKQHPWMHDYPEYGSYICGNQVQFDIAKDQFIRVLNAFNKIEAVKAYLFANSSQNELGKENRLARDFLWENSMHGYFKENVGIYPIVFSDLDDFLNHQMKTAMFHAERGGKYYYFSPIVASDYLNQEWIESYDNTGKKRLLRPCPQDFDHHRSYHYLELTGRGTLECRSVCTQPLDKTFTPIAFQLGLLVNMDKFEKVIEESPLYNEFEDDFVCLRKRFSRMNISEKEELLIRELSRSLLAVSRDGLKKRGYGEEKYLSPLDTMLLDIDD